MYVVLIRDKQKNTSRILLNGYRTFRQAKDAVKLFSTAPLETVDAYRLESEHFEYIIEDVKICEV